MSKKKINYNNLNFSKFKKLANNNKFSEYEKAGFPDDYRKGYEVKIINDIKKKLTNIKKKNINFLDIGCGYTDFTKELILHSMAKQQNTFLIDSKEVLSQIPQNYNLNKINCFFPNCQKFINDFKGKFDAILCYSTIQYIAKETSVENSLNIMIELLAPGGQLLIGDIPNQSKKKRFFESKEGIKKYQKYFKTNQKPIIESIEKSNELNDSFILYLIHFARNKGLEAYLLEQSYLLPFYNRRDDILISKQR